MTRRTRAILTILGGIALLASPAAAQTQGAPLSSTELADLRGGFLVADTIVLDFGAVVRTYVDGQLALESRLTWTETGAMTTQVRGSVLGAVDLAGAMDAALAGGLDLNAIRNGQGLLLSDASGTTALIQTVQGGGIQNLIVNNADGRELRQEVEITLTLPNLEQMQMGYALDRIGGQIAQDLNTAALQSLR